MYSSELKALFLEKSITLKVDEAVITSYGYYECPDCKNQFYGNGVAIHKKECPKRGYSGLFYCVGEKCPEYEIVKGGAE